VKSGILEAGELLGDGSKEPCCIMKMLYYTPTTDPAMPSGKKIN